MTAFITAAFFLLGAIFASFVGVVVGRLHTGQGILRGRSRCDACGKELDSRDLIPIFSWFASSGRSRCCGTKTSMIAPLSELVLGASFALAYRSLGLSWALLAFLAALALLAVLVLYDIAHQILPPPVLALFVLAATIFGYLAAANTMLLSAVFAAFFAAFFAALWLFSGGRAMGLADSPLVAGLSLMTGQAALSGLLFSFWIGATMGIALLAARAKGARMGSEVPFAPFLAAGFLLAYFTQWDPFNITAAVIGLLR